MIKELVLLAQETCLTSLLIWKSLPRSSIPTAEAFLKILSSQISPLESIRRYSVLEFLNPHHFTPTVVKICTIICNISFLLSLIHNLKRFNFLSLHLVLVSFQICGIIPEYINSAHT